VPLIPLRAQDPTPQRYHPPSWQPRMSTFNGIFYFQARMYACLGFAQAQCDERLLSWHRPPQVLSRRLRRMFRILQCTPRRCAGRQPLLLRSRRSFPRAHHPGRPPTSAFLHYHSCSCSRIIDERLIDGSMHSSTVSRSPDLAGCCVICCGQTPS
jgi:hypothetical protein